MKQEFHYIIIPAIYVSIMQSEPETFMRCAEYAYYPVISSISN